MKRRDEYLPSFIDMHEVVGLSPLTKNAAIRSKELPVHCGERASSADRLHVETEKAAGAISVSIIAVDYALKETLQFFLGLKTMNRPVTAHGDGGRVIECRDARTVNRIKSTYVVFEELVDGTRE